MAFRFELGSHCERIDGFHTVEVRRSLSFSATTYYPFNVSVIYKSKLFCCNVDIDHSEQLPLHINISIFRIQNDLLSVNEMHLTAEDEKADLCIYLSVESELFELFSNKADRKAIIELDLNVEGEAIEYSPFDAEEATITAAKQGQLLNVEILGWRASFRPREV